MYNHLKRKTRRCFTTTICFIQCLFGNSALTDMLQRKGQFMVLYCSMIRHRCLNDYVDAKRKQVYLRSFL